MKDRVPRLAAADGKPAQPFLDGPIDSIRWEVLRDGVEDHEYLVILRDLLKSRGAALPAEQRQAMEKLLEVLPEITRDITTFIRDPGPIERRREEIAKAIESLVR